MPRIARAVAPGFPHHIVQRGNNRSAAFFNDEDRAVYLFLLMRYSKKWKAPIISYSLMANHIHLLVKPLTGESLQKTMQGVTLCYTQHINRKYRRTGRLWESRYYSCVVDHEAYLWAVARYIEQNPVRAAMVENPEDYLYSSARAHLGLVQDPVLGEDLFPASQRSDYEAFLKASIPEEQMRDIRQNVRTGRPLGASDFVAIIERSLGKRLAALPIGRPKKEGH
jgi:putative transposase